jgi:hypothetical protein
MKPLLALYGAILLGAVTFASNSLAGEKEEAVMAQCAVTTATPADYTACVGAGLTKNEITTCIKEPAKCYGPNNELRRAFCAIGIGGCPKPPEPTPLIRVVPFRNGCIGIYKSGMYWSPDCQNLRGGGNTVNAWQVEDPDYRFVRGMAIFRDCVITAFSGGGIYKSCNGTNLGGGGQTVRVYQGERRVTSMSVVPYRGGYALRTVFDDGTPYCDPTGDHPGGGPGVTHCEA